MAYPTLTQLKTFMAVSGATLDTELQWALDGAIALTERYCNRSFLPASATINFPVDLPYVNKRRLVLRTFKDFNAVTSVTNGDGVVVSASDYNLMPHTGAPYWGIALKESSGVTWTPGSASGRVAVVADWGMAIPNDVFLTVLGLASWMYDSTQQGVGGPVQSSSRGSGLTVAPSAMPGHLRLVLDSYKRVAI